MDNTSLLLRIGNFPYRYLRQRRLSILESFSLGVALGCADGDFQDPLSNDLRAFQDWFTTKYASFPRFVEARFWRVLQLIAGDDWRAFDLFYSEINEYICQSTSKSDDHGPAIHSPQFDGMTSLLAAIESRSALYGVYSVEALRALLDGYLWTFSDNEQEPDDPIDINGFARWLGRTLQVPEYEEWDRVLVFAFPGESNALSNLWRLLKMFQEQ